MKPGQYKIVDDPLVNVHDVTNENNIYSDDGMVFIRRLSSVFVLIREVKEGYIISRKHKDLHQLLSDALKEGDQLFYKVPSI